MACLILNKSEVDDEAEGLWGRRSHIPARFVVEIETDESGQRESYALCLDTEISTMMSIEYFSRQRFKPITKRKLLKLVHSISKLNSNCFKFKLEKSRQSAESDFYYSCKKRPDLAVISVNLPKESNDLILFKMIGALNDINDNTQMYFHHIITSVKYKVLET